MKKRLFALFTLLLFVVSLFLPSHKAISATSDENKLKFTYNKSIKKEETASDIRFKVTIELNLDKGNNSLYFGNFEVKDKINTDYFEMVKDSAEVSYPDNSAKEKIEINGDTIICDSTKLKKNDRKILIINYVMKMKDGLIIKEDKEVPVSKSTKLTCYVKKNGGYAENNKIEKELDISYKVKINKNILENLLNLNQSSPKTNYKLNEEFNLNYSITPREIKGVEVSGLVSKPKDVVLMVDTSGSMDWDLYGNGFYKDYDGSKIPKVRSIGNFKEFLEQNKYSDSETKRILNYIRYLINNRYKYYGEHYDNWVDALQFDLLYDDPSKYSWCHYNKYYRTWIEDGNNSNVINIVKKIQNYYNKFNFNKSRLDIVKEALTMFLQNFENKSYDKPIRLTLDTFSSDVHGKYLTIELGKDKQRNHEEIENAKKWISALRAKGSTNIGAALEEGEYILKNYQEYDPKTHEQYLVMLTDGVPESDEYGNSAIWYENGASANRENGSIMARAKDYAIKAANGIAKASPNINNYLLGFSKDSPLEQLQSIASAYDKYDLEDIINNVHGDNKEQILKSVNEQFKQKQKDQFPNFNIKQALKAEDINEVYSKIAQEINADITLKNLKFEFQLPKGLEPVELPKGFQYEDGKIIGTLDSIKYKLENGVYKAEKIDFNIKVRGVSPGDIDLKDKAILTYKDVYDNSKKEVFKGLESIKIQEFASIISIIKHGLFLENTGLAEETSISIADRIKTNFGVKFDVNADEKFNMQILINEKDQPLKGGGEIITKIADMVLYKVDGGKLIDTNMSLSSNAAYSKDGNKVSLLLSNLKLEKGEYILVYRILPKLSNGDNNVFIENNVIHDQQKNNNVSIIIQPLPDLD